MSKLTRGRVIAFILAAVTIIAIIALAGCTGETGPTGATGPTGPTGATGPPGEDAIVACQACHNAGTGLKVKQLQYSNSGHAAGLTWAYAGGRDNCTSCHSSEGFTTWLAAGGATSDTVAAENTTPINCRTCHEIHTTYTGADFALTATAPVTMITDATKTYDMGASNLCASCHQARTAPPAVGVGTSEVTSSHYGPHHGPQANVLLGTGGYSDPGEARPQGEASPHYTQTGDGCVTCHMGDGAGIDDGGHTFTPTLASCQSCHEGLDTFDRHDVQTEIQALYDELEELLRDIGILEGEHSSVPGTYTEAQVAAFFNWKIVQEDGSMGVHNSYYLKQLLEYGIDLVS